MNSEGRNKGAHLEVNINIKLVLKKSKNKYEKSFGKHHMRTKIKENITLFGQAHASLFRIIWQNVVLFDVSLWYKIFLMWYFLIET